jgi:hypothetical protein
MADDPETRDDNPDGPDPEALRLERFRDKFGWRPGDVEVRLPPESGAGDEPPESPAE